MGYKPHGKLHQVTSKKSLHTVNSIKNEITNNHNEWSIV